MTRRAWSTGWRAVLAVLAVTMLSGTAAHASGKSKPTGTIRFSEGSVAVGIGYQWGKGVLTYKGHHYRFKITGLTAGELGGNKITARGEVYHLRKLSDFNGTYTSAGAGATAAGGFDVEAMRNGNGVEIKVVSTTKGADIRAAVEGVTITLE